MNGLRKYLVEFIGSFFLVLTIGSTLTLGNPGTIAPLAIGTILMVMIYAGGAVSGAHYNPAVTLAVFIRGAMPKRDVFPYMIAQVAGGAVAALAVMEFRHVASPPVPPFNFRIHDLLLAEFLFTFALAFVVLSVATLESTAGNAYFGLAIGGTVMAGAFAVGGAVCSGAFNPAVEVGLAGMRLTPWGNSWLTILANFTGAAVAAFAFLFLHPEKKKSAATGV